MTPTQRSLALLTKQGYTARVVEHWNHYAKIRQDLFGFIDIVALHPDRKGVLGVQTTTKGNVQARINKALLIPPCKLWLECGNQIEFHGWEKVNGKWQIETREFVIADGGAIMTLSL